ncbi:MAG: DsbE family thiol:disulfide interchange protein [Pacificimonas sp.]|jgi:cytochrome c biogenesis protein CcmG/thiol:disulfide interchange protein DsbE|nr:DsbE family thiol:disulfide interchange protein [Pacificimonas sp.]
MIRRLALILPLAAFVIFVIIAIGGLGQPQTRQIESRLVGEPVPDFVLEPMSDARPGLSSADLKSGEPVLVNLFGSWCLPCRIEAPQLDRLAEAGATIHAVAIRDEPAAVADFLSRYGDPFAHIGMDPRGRMQIEFGATGVPETYLIDGDGIIRGQWIGEVRENDVAEILAAMEALR